MVETIECSHCHEVATRLSFPTEYGWSRYVTTDPSDGNIFNQREVYVCPQCGRVTLAKRKKEVHND